MSGAAFLRSEPSSLDPIAAEPSGELPTGGPPPVAPEPEPAASPFARFSPRRITNGAPLLPLGVLFGLNAVDELDRAAFTVLSPEIRDHFNLSLTGISVLLTLTIPASIVLGIPIAYFADRRSRLRIARAGAGIWSAFSVASGLAPTVVVLGAARVMAGLARAVNDPTHNSLLPDYYEPGVRVKVYSAHRAANSVGQFFSPILAGTLLVGILGLSWRIPFIVFAIPTVVLIVISLRLKEPTRGAHERRASGADEETALLEERPPNFSESWRTILAIKTLRRIYFALPFLLGSLLGLGLMLANYYEDVFGIGPFGRGLIAGLDEPFSIVGLLVGAPIAQRAMSRKPALAMRMLAFFAVGISGLLAIQAIAPTVWVAVPAGFARAAISAILTPAIYAVLSLCIPPKARALGFTAGGLFALLGLPLVVVAAAIGDSAGLRAGILFMIPLFLIGAFLIASSGAFVEGDIQRVRAASLAQAEARKARQEGDPKILLVRGLDVSYGQTQVLFNVDFHVDEGEIVALLGTNGAGKSTLLNAISGLVDPGAGAIVYDGNDITLSDPNTTAAEGIVFVPGGKGVFPTLTVQENLNLAGWLFRKDPEHVARATEQVLDYFPVLKKRWTQKAGNLSGGEQQMLTLGQAFIAQPKLLMIDELSLGLAPVIVEQLLGIVRDIHAQGTTIILVEQSVNVAMSLAQRAVFMEKGEVRFDGPTAELLERPDVLRAVFLQGTQAAADTGPGAGAGVAVNGANGATGSTTAAPLAVAVREKKPFVADCEHCGAHHAMALATDSIAVSFGGVKAVNGVSLSVHQGEILGLIGPNGAGKTTVFDLISGYVTPTDGKVFLGGREVTGALPEERAVLGLGRSFQDARLFPSMTVRETIAVALERHIETKDPVAAVLMSPATKESERHVAEEVERLIELMHLGAFADKFVGELSTGSRRVVDLACSVAHDPKVLLLDEPSSGIAQRETEALGPLLLDLREKTGAALIVIEHDMPLITAVSDRLLALELGTVIAEGEPDEVVSHPRVVESYLGGSDVVINRSGLLPPGDERGPTRRRTRRRRTDVPGAPVAPVAPAKSEVT